MKKHNSTSDGFLQSGVCEGGDADSIIEQLPKSCTSQHVLPFETCF